MRGYINAFQHYLTSPTSLLSQIRMTRHGAELEEPFVFVIGPPRSGTTLMHRVLMNHSCLTGFEEETAIFSLRSVEDTQRFSHFVSDAQHSEALFGAVSLAEFCLRLHEIVLNRPKGGRFVEKTPQHAKWLHYIAARFPAAQFVFCVRDPRDTYCSALASGVIPQSKNLHKHASYFNKCAAGLITAPQDLQRRTHVVRYEDFVSDPALRLSTIMAFLGLEPEVECQISTRGKITDRRAARPEFSRLSEAINNSSVARWKTEMSVEDADRYAKLAGSTMRFFNYV